MSIPKSLSKLQPALQVRFCSVSARVDQAPDHDLGNLDAFNTDGSWLR